jgi:radical SAM protein with 4Fe4S-binding SPASM domain
VTSSLRPELPREIQVEVTGACNLACKMCLVRYRPKLGKTAGAMCLHTFRKIVDELPHLERVTLQGLGEPLLAPDIFRMIEYAATRGVRVGFNTNGTLLTRPRAERLVATGLDWLHVSLDGASAATYNSIRDGSDFELVRRNVRGLVDVMHRVRAERPELSLVFVAMRRNVDELPALVRLAREWGVGRLWVQNLSHSFDDTDPAGDYRQIRRFAAAEALWQSEQEAASKRFAEAARLAVELGVELRLPRLEAPTREQRRSRRGCDWPWRSAFVTHDAKVQPCCMVMGSDRAQLGDVTEGGFASVWTSDDYAAFRRRLLNGDPPDVCRGCSAYRGVF